jgi:hypothetical protein
VEAVIARADAGVLRPRDGQSLCLILKLLFQFVGQFPLEQITF